MDVIQNNGELFEEAILEAENHAIKINEHERNRLIDCETGDNDSDNLSTSSSVGSTAKPSTSPPFVYNNGIFKQFINQNSYGYNPEFLNMVNMLHPDRLTRTCSNASSASFASSCSSSSSSSSSTYSSHSFENNEQHFNSNNNNNNNSNNRIIEKADESISSGSVIASFADKFAHMIRSRSNSVSETASPSTNILLSSPSNKRASSQLKTEETIKSSVTCGTQCKVCGDEASGYHYGVDSCEGCKGFFRRCITQGMNHQCTNNQQCEMTPFSRNSCQFCRLKKCFEVGMSREASRLGRRPKRVKDESDSSNTIVTTPVKQEETSKHLLKISKFSPISETRSDDEKLKVLKKEKSIDNLVPFKLDVDEKSTTEATYQPESPQSSSSSSSSSNSVLIQTDFNDSSSMAQIQKESAQTRMHQIEMMTKLISYSDKYTSVERTSELEYMRTCIIDSHLRIWPTTFDKIRQRYMEKPPNRLSDCLLQVDTLFTHNLVSMITDVVRFCKNIPGFQHIQQHDQIQLLKQGSFEVIIVNSFMLIDAQNKLMLSFDMDYLMDKCTIGKIPFGFFIMEIFDLGIEVSSLKLTDSEIALINALLIMNPDRGDLQDKDLVEELQATVLHVLYKHLKYFRNDGTELFLKLLKIIPQVQEISRKHSDTINALNLSN